MKRLAILLTCLALPLTAQDRVERPLFCNIRITAEYIEIPHETLTAVMRSEHSGSDPRLHAHMRSLVKAGRSRIMETAILTTRSGYRNRLEAATEHIYPTEYEPPGLPGTFIGPAGRSDDNEADEKHVRATKCPTAFETRNVGVFLEVEPVVDPGSDLVDLHLTQELSRLLRYETWRECHDQWGDASIRFPIYETLRSKHSLTLVAGRFSFLGVVTPTRNSGSPDTSRKILLFLRADIIPVGP